MYSLSRWLSGKESACWCRRHRRHGFDPWVGKILRRRKWQPTPVFLPGEFHGQRSLVDYSPKGRKESDTTEQLSACVHVRTHTHTGHENCIFANIVSHSEGCLFILCVVSFAVQKLLSLIRFHLFIFVFIFITLRDELKRICYNLCQCSFIFSSKDFMVSSLSFKY